MKMKHKKSGKVSNRIRELRQQFPNLTQAELGKRVEATRQTIIAIEQGKYAPSMELAFRIVREFGCNFEEVFQFDPDGS